MTVHFCLEAQVQWLDSDEFSTEFLRLLGAAQEGGSMVSECFLAASRIDPRDRAASWYREWIRIADLSRERGNTAFERGRVLTAQSNWLRGVEMVFIQFAGFTFGKSASAYATPWNGY